MSAPPGWYPDPGGSDAFRYWDGASWSAETNPHPQAPPPGLGARVAPTPPRSRSTVGWLVALVALVVVVVLVGFLAVRQVVGGGGLLGGDPGRPSDNTCPTAASSEPSSAARPADGRAHGGRLSFPRLGSPWDAPNANRQVAFGRDVEGQFVTIETGDFSNFTRWGAEVMVGELIAGDGFFAPRDGVEIILRCAMGTFYGDNEVSRTNEQSEKLVVDGHDGWITVAELGFDIAGLQAKHEKLTVVVIDIGDGTAGLFLSSVPENGPQYAPQARDALRSLRVDS